MARTAGKKPTKPAPPAPLPATTSSIPKPFVVAPAQLRPLTNTLPTDHVFAIHADPNVVELKKRVFMVPVMLNIIITALLMVRVYYAAPIYLDQMITIFGYETAWKVEPATMAYGSIIDTVVRRSGLLMVDYTIFAFIGSWPWEFLFGSKYTRHTGPVHWRRKVGFQETEIVVRKGRKWDDILFPKEENENKVWTREDELAIQVKVDAAMRKDYTSKTGYQLLDKDWDLDFKAMIDAHRLVEKDRLDLKDLDHIVLVHYQKQWLLWRVHAETQAVVPNTKEDEAIQNFRKRLAELNHEDVFFRWIEIVQYETSLAAGFTRAKQNEALNELKRLLAERNIDYSKFLQDMGGEDAIPGLRQKR